MTKQYRFEGKGLSIIQPWVSVIAFAGKDIENRSWRTARDHIAEAIYLIDTDRAEATRLLTLTHNSLSAFSAAQALFDPF